jgi:hypothetical protein
MLKKHLSCGKMLKDQGSQVLYSKLGKKMLELGKIRAQIREKLGNLKI